MAATIAEFLASIGFKVDEKGMKAALAKVAGFGAACSVAAGAAIAGIMRVAQSEVELVKKAEGLGVPIQKLEELGYVAEQTGASADAVATSLGSLKSKYPHIKDASVLLERAGRAMRGMSDQAARLYARRMGIDPALVPMLTRDVSALKGEFAAMYAVAGRDAQKAAEDSKAFMAELGKLRSMCDLLAKAVGGAFLGKIRGDVESLRRVVMENFGKIKRLFETIISLVLRVAGVVGAFVRRVVTWAAALVSWYDKLTDGQKRIVQGLALFLAAWKLLNAGFLATPLGAIIAGLAAIVALIDDYCTYMEGGTSYFNWGPYEESIQAVLEVLKKFWDVICAVGSAILSALVPALGVINEQCRWIFNTLVSLGKIFWQLFTGDIGGALESAKAMLADWAKSGRAILENFCAAISNFFSTLWAGITESFPDFAAWAEGAAKAIMDFFAPAIDWIKGKIRSMASILPEFLQKKLGLSGDTAAPEKQGAPAPAAPPVIPPGAALKPSPLQAHGAVSKNTSVKVDSKAEITVNGAQNPEQVAGKVAAVQGNVAADIARNTQGAVR